MVDKLYNRAKDYQVALIKYKEYQNDAQTLSSDEKMGIMADERFGDIQEKLRWLKRFDTLTSSKA